MNLSLFKRKYLLLSFLLGLIIVSSSSNAIALLGFPNPLDILTSNTQLSIEPIKSMEKIGITRLNTYIQNYFDEVISHIKDVLDYSEEKVEKRFIFTEFMGPFCIIILTLSIGFVCFSLQNKGALPFKKLRGPFMFAKNKVIKYIILCSLINIASFCILRFFLVNNFITEKLLKSLFIVMILTIIVRFFTKLFFDIDLFIDKKLNFKNELPRFKKGQVLVLHVGYFIIFSLISLVGCIPYAVTALGFTGLPFNVWGPTYAEITTVLMDGLVGFYALCIVLFIINNRKSSQSLPIRFSGLTLNSKTIYWLANLCAVLTYFLYMGTILRIVTQNIFNTFLSLTTFSIFLLLHKKAGKNVSKYIHAFVDAAFSTKFIELFGRKNVQKYTYITFNIITIFLASFIILSFWHNEKILRVSHFIGIFILEKCVGVTLLIYFTRKLQTFLNFTIKRIIFRRTTIPVHMRDNSRLYALLLMTSYFTPFIWIPTFVIILLMFGVSGNFILSAFGIIALAIGFGAKDLIEDIARGFFLIIDKTLDIGESVTIHDKIGIIEALTLRSVSWRGDDGVLHSIPYSKIDLVSNHTSEFVYTVLEIGVSYDADLLKAMQVLSQVGDELLHDPTFAPLILAPLEVLGVSQLGDHAIMIKSKIKVVPLQEGKIQRELNFRVKQRFDQEGIILPSPQMNIRILHENN